MKGVLLIICFFVLTGVSAQSVIHFPTRLHDFGSIKETNGAVSYDFEFVNTGKSPVLIKNVESSCGCTSPQWSRQPVLPGQKGSVRATFEPKDRPGFFDKTITVYTNTTTPVVELKIKGMVEGRARTVLDDFPYELPSGLRLPLESVSLMKVRKGDTKKMEIEVFNNSGKDAAVAFAGLPSHIQMSIEPGKIPNKGRAKIMASFNTGAKGEFGLNEEEVTIIVNGKKYPLRVSVFVEEDLSQADMASAPAIDADKKYYNFGTTASAKPVAYTYQVKNSGKSPLKIHRVYANDQRVEVQVAKNELQPGESAPVSVTTKNGATPGKLTCLISVISNSPATPELSLRFYGEIN